MVRVSVAFTIWIVIPAFYITMANISTGIRNEICVPWGIFSSFVMTKTALFSVIFVNYLLPLALMIFCYSRIVCSLRNKVRNIFVVFLTRFCDLLSAMQ